MPRPKSQKTVQKPTHTPQKTNKQHLYKQLANLAPKTIMKGTSFKSSSR